jgi:hypothetical protein
LRKCEKVHVKKRKKKGITIKKKPTLTHFLIQI